MLVLTKRKYALPNAILLAVILICVMTLGVKRSFSREVTGYLSSIEEPDLYQQVTVTFDGTYTDYLLRVDRYDGFIDVSPFPFLPDESYIPDHAKERIDPWNLPITTDPQKLGTIGYFMLENDSVSHVIRGILWAKEDLEVFIMSCMVPEVTKNGSTHWKTVGYLSYPEALTAEEAEALMFPENNP